MVAVDPVTDRWRILVYFDMPGSTPEGVEAAATAIGNAADEMVALGDVEIVTADRLPETVLGPTNDAGAIRQGCRPTGAAGQPGGKAAQAAP